MPQMSLRFAPALLLTLGLLGSGLAQAQTSQKLIPAQSSLVFVSKQLGVPVEGQFKKFEADVAINPAKPQASRIVMRVDMNSASLGAPEADVELPKPVWFNVPKFPQAVFESTTVNNLGGGKWEVAGKLSIKGISREVVVPVVLTQTGTSPNVVTVAQGSMSLKRLTYKIGENEWADTSMVADDVQVKFKLTLSGVGKL